MILWLYGSILSKNNIQNWGKKRGKGVLPGTQQWTPQEISPLQVSAGVGRCAAPANPKGSAPGGLAVSRAVWRSRCLAHRAHHSSSTTSTESHQGNEPSLAPSLELKGAFPNHFWELWWFRNVIWCVSVVWGFGSGTDLELLRQPGGKLCFLGVIIYPEHLCWGI